MKKIIRNFTVLGLLTFSVASMAGNGVGGGVSFSVINWCDDASTMIRESRDNALERLGQSGDKVGALRIYYQGFIDTAASTQQTEAEAQSSLTFKAIARGVKLSQLMGVPALLNGQGAEAGLSGQKQIDGLLSFMDWYSLQIEETANAVDRNYYIPYRHNNDRSRVTVRELEERMIKISVLQLKGLENNFASLKSDRSSYFVKISVPQFFQALSYLSAEVASDLSDSLFSSALDCQTKRLNSLSRQVQTYLDGRTSDQQDPAKLNRYVIELDSIIESIEQRTCSRF